MALGAFRTRTSRLNNRHALSVNGAAGMWDLRSPNLLKWSEDFSNAAWLQIGPPSVTANSTTAPDGSLTADKLVEANAGDTYHAIYQNVSIGGAGAIFSFYAKAAERTWVQVNLKDSTNNNAFSYFNLATGVVGTLAAQHSATINSAGSGWYRITVSVATTPSSPTYDNWIGVAPADNTPSYVGNGSSGIYIWGAQLNEGSSPLPYTATTDLQRISVGGGGIPMRREVQNNMLKWSEDFGNSGWLKFGSTATTSALTETLSGAYHNIYQEGIGTAGATYSLGVEASAGTGRYLALYDMGYLSFFDVFDLQNGVVVVNNTGTAIITSLGGGWYKCSRARTISAATTFYIGMSNGSAISYTGTGLSINIRNAQLNPGTTPLPYIKTQATVPVSSVVYDPAPSPLSKYTYAAVPWNLLTYSEDFSNGAWENTWSGITKATDALTATADGNQHKVKRGIGGLVSGAVYTFSVEAKANGYSYLYLNPVTSGDNATYFNLTNGTVGTSASGNTASIAAMGGGYYRCTVSRVTSAASVELQVGIASVDNGGTSFIGDGILGIYIRNAQLNPGPTADTYVKTTTAAVYHEAETRQVVGTNLLKYSEDFSNALWIKEDAATKGPYNEVVAPDNSNTADTISWTGAGDVYNVSSVVAGSNTFSIWARCASGTQTFRFMSWSPSDAASTTTDNTVTTTWQRFSVTRTFTGTSIVHYILNGSDNAARTIHFWGAQLNPGTLPDRYTKTEGVALEPGYPWLQLGSTVGADTNDPVRRLSGMVFDGVDDFLITSSVAYGTSGTIVTTLATSNLAPAAYPNIGGAYSARPKLALFSGNARPFIQMPGGQYYTLATSYDTNWHSIVGTYDAIGNVKLYVDSSYKGGASGTAFAGASGSFDVGSGALAGTVAAAMLYSRELTPTDIRRNHYYFKKQMSQVGVTLT